MPGVAVDAHRGPAPQEEDRTARPTIIRKMPPRTPLGGLSPSSLRPNQSRPAGGRELDEQAAVPRSRMLIVAEVRRDAVVPDSRDRVEHDRRWPRRRTPPRGGWRRAGSSAGWVSGARTRFQRRWPYSVLSVRDPSVFASERVLGGTRHSPPTTQPARAPGSSGAGPAAHSCFVFCAGAPGFVFRRWALYRNTKLETRA